MFRASLRPSSGVLKTVTATSGMGHNIGAAASFQRGLIRTSVSELTLRPSSGVLKTVTATCGIGHNIGVANSFQRGPIRTSVLVLIRPRWKEAATPIL
jgi:hypothetical protein